MKEEFEKQTKEYYANNGLSYDINVGDIVTLRKPQETKQIEHDLQSIAKDTMQCTYSTIYANYRMQLAMDNGDIEYEVVDVRSIDNLGGMAIKIKPLTKKDTNKYVKDYIWANYMLKVKASVLDRFKVGDTVVSRGDYGSVEDMVKYTITKVKTTIDCGDVTTTLIDIASESGQIFLDESPLSYVNVNEIHEDTVCSQCGKKYDSRFFGDVDMYGNNVCNLCIDRYYCYCEDCGRLETRDDGYTTHDDHFICNECYDENYSTCPDCGEVYHDDDMREGEDGHYYCYNCIDRHIEEEDHYCCIKSYHDRPEIKYYGDNGDYTTDGSNFKGYGFELEVDDGGESDDNARRVMEILNKSVYCNSDGSISDGFEIISHPHTRKALEDKKDSINEALSYLVREGYRSHDARTCGLHLHASRLLFGDNEKKRTIAISKIILFYEIFWQDILKVSRRTESQVRDWANKYCERNTNSKDMKKQVDNIVKDDTRGSHLGRYYAVNLCNRDTVEFRLMRGTLNKATFWATLDFLMTTAENSTKITYKDLNKPEKWLEGLKPETLEYIRSRGAFESVVGARDTATTVSQVDQATEEELNEEEEEDDE